MKFAIYSRKSVCTEEGESIENQIKMCKKYIQSRIKTDVLEEEIQIYQDEGFSGQNINRPQFKLMIGDINRGKFDYLVCYKLDRISRSVSDFSSFIKSLESKRIEFVSIKEQFDTSTPIGRAMMYICAVFAQMERESIAERIRDNLLLLARTGRCLGGSYPTGFSAVREESFIVDGKAKKASYLMPNKDIDTVRLIFSKFLEIGNIMSVSRYLFENNIRTVNNKHFIPVSIRHILTNPVYCTADKDSLDYFRRNGSHVYFDEKDFPKKLGLMSFNKHFNNSQNAPVSDWIISVGKHEGIINGKDWVNVQSILSNNKSHSRTRKSFALLSNLIICPLCGSKMITKTGHIPEVYYYICRFKRHFGSNSCNSKNLNGKQTDNLIINYLMNYDENQLKNDLNIETQTTKVSKLLDNIDDINSKIYSLNYDKEKYLDYLKTITSASPLFKDIEIKFAKINDQIKNLELQKRKQQLELSIAQTQKADVQQILKNLRYFKSNFFDLDLLAKKSLLRLIVEQITWSDEKLTIKFKGEST